MREKKNILTKKAALEKIYEMRDADKPFAASGVSLHGVSLTREDLHGVDFSGVDLSEVDLTGANLSHARFFKANLKNASLMGANLHRADLTGADLTNVNLEEADCSNAGLGMANLSHARLFDVNLRDSSLSKANLYQCDLRAANMVNARMREASLVRADLSEADLAGADLARCTVGHAIFNNASLRDARLRLIKDFESAEWIGVDLRDINFAGAYTLRRFIIDQNYLKEFRDRSRYSRVLYHIWWATSDCGRSLLRWCGWIGVLVVLFAWIFTMVDVQYRDGGTWIDSFYFSVVTLSTLGYGDIVPISPAAKIVAMIEVMSGYVMLGGLLTIFNNKLARRGD